MARLYLALFSFIFCHNFYLNCAEQQLSKRVYVHQRKDSKDDLSILPKSNSEPITDIKKRRALSTAYKTSPIFNNDFYNEQSHFAPTVPKPSVPEAFPTKSLSDSSVNTSKNDDKKKKKLGHSPLNIRHKKKLSPTPLAPIEEKPEHGLLTAARNLRIDLVKFYLSINSFNPNKPRDQFGNTAFHVIASRKTKLYSSTEENREEKIKTANAIIDLLLKDFRTDFSIKNNAGSTPRELLSSDLDTILRIIFFSRCSLNIFVNEYAEKLKNAFSDGSISPEVIEATVEQIIGKLKDVETSQQKDRKLPPESRFPVHATVYFMEQMLLARLNYITNDN